MTETKLNRCDMCEKLSEDVIIQNGIRFCPECFNSTDGIDAPLGIDEEIFDYDMEARNAMLEKIAMIKAELRLSDKDDNASAA